MMALISHPHYTKLEDKKMKINYDMSWDAVYDALIVVTPIALAICTLWRFVC